MRTIFKKNKDSSYEASFDKLKLIENYFLDYDCVIVTCGPSFNDYKDDVLGLINSRTLLICVKQTYDYLKVCDFYIPGTVANTVKHPNCNGIIIGVQVHNHPDYLFFDRQRNINLADINFVASGRSPTLYDIPKNIDSMSFKKNALTSKAKMVTHLGHAMHAIALPLAIHLGAKNIFIIGWDGHRRSDKSSHFYQGGQQDLSHYGSTAVTECNKHTVKFCKEHFNVNLYQINTRSLYDMIPKITIDECINRTFTQN